MLWQNKPLKKYLILKETSPKTFSPETIVQTLCWCLRVDTLFDRYWNDGSTLWMLSAVFDKICWAYTAKCSFNSSNHYSLSRKIFVIAFSFLNWIASTAFSSYTRDKTKRLPPLLVNLSMNFLWVACILALHDFIYSSLSLPTACNKCGAQLCNTDILVDIYCHKSSPGHIVVPLLIFSFYLKQSMTTEQ